MTKLNTYPSLITEVCVTQKTIENVSKAIPVLIRWAQNGITDKHYEDLNKELGYGRFSGIGHVLGCIDVVLKQLNNKPEFDDYHIPTLNALCTNKSTNLPSYGFEFVQDDWNLVSEETQRLIVEGYNIKATKYPQWNKVLSCLCLLPSIEYSAEDEERIRNGERSKCTESEEHKKLKTFIASNPSSIHIYDVEVAKNEFILLSGDRLDVYFELHNKSRIAIEVKSLISSDDDILRGIYQCVKYKATLDAENLVHGLPVDTRAVLVIEGKLSESNYYVKKSLGVEVIENFKY